MPDSLGPPSGRNIRTLVIATGHDLSLALLHDAEVVAERHSPMLKGHAEALVPAIADLLVPFGGAAHRCDRILVETGPGSFTGLRVGLAAGRALALAWGAGILGVRSTQLVEAEVRDGGASGALLVALAAPRGQVWVEGFGPGLAHPPTALSAADARVIAARYPLVAGTALVPAGEEPRPPRAAAAHGLAFAGLGGAEILYVRAPDASETAGSPG